MWYATQQPRQQFVLEEAIAYDAPLAGLGALGVKTSAQARQWTKAMAGRPSKKATRYTPGAKIATGYIAQPARPDPTVTRYTSPIAQTRARFEAATYNTLQAQLARQAAALQAKYEQENPWLFRDPNIVARGAEAQAQVEYADAPVMQIDPATGRLMQGLSGFGALGRGGRYARAMRAIQPLKGVPRGRVIIPEGYTAESLRAAYDPRAQARQDIAQILAAQSGQAEQFGQEAQQPQVAARSARQGKQFSEAVWQDPRMVEMMTPDPRTGWARMTIGPGKGRAGPQKPKEEPPKQQGPKFPVRPPSQRPDPRFDPAWQIDRQNMPWLLEPRVFV